MRLPLPRSVHLARSQHVLAEDEGEAELNVDVDDDPLHPRNLSTSDGGGTTLIALGGTTTCTKRERLRNAPGASAAGLSAGVKLALASVSHRTPPNCTRVVRFRVWYSDCRM